MTQDWQIGFRQAVADMLMTQGSFIDDGNYYGDGWSSRHTLPEPYGAGCQVKSVDVSEVEDDHFTSFAGTFDSDREVTVLVAKATCECGKFTGARFGWEGSLTDALHLLLNDR